MGCTQDKAKLNIQEAERSIFSDVCSEDEMQKLKENTIIPMLFCQNKNSITSVCATIGCPSKYGLLCQSETCNICSKEHLGCMRIPLNDITALIQKQYEDQKQFILEMMLTQNKMILRLKEFRKALAKKYVQLNLPERFQKIFENISQNKEDLNVDRSLVLEMVALLQKSSKSDKKVKLLEEFAEKAQVLFEELTSKKEELIKHFFQGLVLEGGSLHKFDSKIISSSQDIAFVKSSLNKPQHLQLLFRASQHNFLASEFHKACDNIPHTLTIIKTQFQKVIAGYTPLCWKSSGGEWGVDNLKQSFLLSLDLQQKMMLFDSSAAMYCYSGCGPRFGGGADIHIGDMCDANLNSFARFPTSYNNQNRTFQKSQQTYAAFSGATNSQYFKVVEYEVYRVVW